jgi:hypothetical protein
VITKLTAKEKNENSRFIGLLAALMYVVSFPVNGAVAGKKAGAESKSARIEGTTSDRFQRGNIIMSRAIVEAVDHKSDWSLSRVPREIRLH